MNKRYIIKESNRFNELIANAPKVMNQYFIVFYQDNSQAFNRYGISVGKKIGKAHIRNHLKRQVRAIVAEYQKNYFFSTDCIIMIRKSCLTIPFSKMEQMLLQLLNIIKEKKDEEKKIS